MKTRLCRAIALLIILTVCIGSTSQAKRKLIKEYIGKWYVSSYHVSDNTPSGSRRTSSGATATEWWTCAVDLRNPIVEMGTEIHIQGFGHFKIQDYGGFGHLNGGRRAFDIFLPEGVGGLFYRKVWVYRKETKKEYNKRMTKKRQKRHKKPFIPVFVENIPENIIYADPRWIKGGTIRIGYNYYDVKPCYGLESHILINDENLVRWHSEIQIDEVIENARG